MKNNQNKHDDELAELDIKLLEAENELIKYKDKVKELVDNKEKMKLEMMIGYQRFIKT